MLRKIGSEHRAQSLREKAVVRGFIEKKAKYVRNLSRGEAIPLGKGLSKGVLRTFGGCVIHSLKTRKENYEKCVVSRLRERGSEESGL